MKNKPKEFRVCPQCGYERGFHLFFQETPQGIAVGLICPNCGRSYDPGWLNREIDRPLVSKKGKQYGE